MRILIASLLFTGGVLAASTSADETRLVEKAPRRWAEDGSGGAPDFVRHVVPLFSKMGCNMRACHGSFQGQNGFRLSLFGFEPDRDREQLLEIDEESEGNGPRINLDDPDQSLFLMKPISSEDDHGGGKRMEKNGWRYRLLHQWISAGAP
ncbi:MAG: hypothetical protein N2C14_12530, partial [Planctomycetales bacterium]